MSANDNPNATSDNRIFIGLDVHKNKWSVTIRTLNMELKTFSMEPSPAVLAKHLRKHYPSGQYYSIYEAGFCGFWIHRELCEQGIRNVVVNPADVPTSDKERDKKTDPRDSRKLARELQKGELEALFVPGLEDEHLRTLCRARRKCRQQSNRVMNRIRSHLAFAGEPTPEESAWSGAFIRRLESAHQEDRADHLAMRYLLAELRQHRLRHASILRDLRRLLRASHHAETLRLLMTIPGVGFITAATIVTELVDVRRFKKVDHMYAMIGLVPSTNASGERSGVRGLSKRKNAYLKHLIIEAAWTAVRKDPELTECYGKLLCRMTATRAIIRIAKKLVNRIRFVWLNQQPYQVNHAKVA